MLSLDAEAIIPLGRRSLDGSMQPTRGFGGERREALPHLTGRAGPPLLFGLAPRGVYRAADIAVRAVGSYPTVSPLPSGAI